jgi:hypothetical protein
MRLYAIPLGVLAGIAVVILAVLCVGVDGR